MRKRKRGIPAALAVKFAHFTKAEAPHVARIIERAVDAFRLAQVERSRLDIDMDLSAVHARIPLRLRELADADTFNFNHDLFGIYRHLNRETGTLEGHFVPRFAKPLRPTDRGAKRARIVKALERVASRG